MMDTTINKNDFKRGEKKIKKYFPGFLVKNMRQNNFGILIKKDRLHDDFWHVFSSQGVVSWYESNFEIIG